MVSSEFLLQGNQEKSKIEKIEKNRKNRKNKRAFKRKGAEAVVEKAAFAKWIIEIAIVWAIIFAVQIPVRRSDNIPLRIIIFIAKVILVPATALLFLSIDWGFTYRHGDVFAAMYIVLIGDITASIIEFIIRLIRKPTRTSGKKQADCQASATPL